MTEEKKEEKPLTSKVVATGIIQAVHHHILAVQMEKKCDKITAIQETRKLLKTIDDFLKEEFEDK